MLMEEGNNEKINELSSRVARMKEVLIHLSCQPAFLPASSPMTPELGRERQDERQGERSVLDVEERNRAWVVLQTIAGS